MSEKAKLRAVREGKEPRSARSKAAWLDPAYVLKQVGVREGKRLRRPKLSDKTVDEIRALYVKEKADIVHNLLDINRIRKLKNAGWKPLLSHSEFAKKYAPIYGVSSALIRNIVLWKMRTEILPSICKY
jgi:hypothetical protein